MKNEKHFHSFAELAKAMGVNPVKRNKEKLESQREKFVNRHICRACGKAMEWIPDTNQMVCKNPECKGIKFTKVDKETGESKVVYGVSFSPLDNLGAKIARDIFNEHLC